MLLVFMVATNTDKLKRVKKSQRNIILVAVSFIAIGLGYTIFQEYALKTTTYMYRFNGWLNYLAYYEDDAFHMIFGNAENVYDQNTSYVLTVRSITGWNGSLEFAWLDVLIKNGILGIIGFAIVFIRYFRGAAKEKTWVNKGIIYGYLSVLLASSLVETYIQSVHSVYGLYSYLILSGFITIDSTKRRELIHKMKSKIY